MVQAVLLDIAGVLYDGRIPLPGAIESVAKLQQQSVPLRFVTNTSRQSPQQVKQYLDDLGFNVKQEQLFTAPAAVVAYLENRHMTCYALVHPNLDVLFEPFQSTAPDAVVVADAGERFDYMHMNQAFQHLMAGAQLIAIGDNRYFKKAEELVLDAGPFIHALAYASDKKPIIVGKPSTTFYEVVVASTRCAAQQVLMIGDDVVADCEGAIRAGLLACLVRTGKYRPGDEARCELQGLMCADDLPAALELVGL